MNAVATVTRVGAIPRSPRLHAPLLVSSIPQKPVRRSQPQRRFRIYAESGTPSEETNKETTDPADLIPDDEPTLTGKIFGSYLQLGVWIVVLTFAGYKGFQQAQTDPSSVGLLLAPPSFALFLIVSFLIYRFGGSRDKDL